jgi:hypothetical protein
MKTFENHYKHMQHLDKILAICNIQINKLATYVSKTDGHWEKTLATYVYNHCNICDIPIYFCNVYLKHLQHTFKTFETLTIYACNMRVQLLQHM